LAEAAEGMLKEAGGEFPPLGVAVTGPAPKTAEALARSIKAFPNARWNRTREEILTWLTRLSRNTPQAIDALAQTVLKGGLGSRVAAGALLRAGRTRHAVPALLAAIRRPVPGEIECGWWPLWQAGPAAREAIPLVRKAMRGGKGGDQVWAAHCLWHI